MATKKREEEPEGVAEPPAVRVARRPRGSASLKTLARRRLADSIVLIVEALVAKSVEGSVVHLKLLLELAGALGGGGDKARRGNTVARMLLEEWTSRRGDGVAKGGWGVVAAESDDGGVHGV